MSAAQARKLLASVRPRDLAGKTRKRVATELVADLDKIYARTKAADKELTELVKATGTGLLDLHGIGPSGAARLLVEVGDITRFPDRGHFASWTGTAPIDASSGDHIRHRLSRGGNRQINRALHVMAVVQLRNPTQGRVYFDRKKTTGKTSMEAMRCLKRRLSDLVYMTMLDDLVAAQKTGPAGQPGNDSVSSATGSQPQHRLFFAPYPRRAVLDGCSHCRPSRPVDEHDLFSLTIRLGNTVGSREDSKSLLPLLLERLVACNELDPGIVLSNLSREQWRTWLPVEQQAVEEYLDRLWRSLPTELPSRIEAVLDAAESLDAAALTGDGIDRFLAACNTLHGAAPDQHLALLVNGYGFADPHRKVTTAWLCREAIRDRLLTAFGRDHDSAWADDLASAYDILRWQPMAEQASVLLLKFVA
ncbi:transposase [Kribbella sp. NBC_00359]|uniref:transposase n=1 Tax=Kribbella sp. NBC_00359 TaxID=2975966 RepID=UPI002E217B11